MSQQEQLLTTQRTLATLSDLSRPSCVWRCKCGLALIARRGETSLVLQYRGLVRRKCPHCGRPVPVELGGPR